MPAVGASVYCPWCRIHEPFVNGRITDHNGCRGSGKSLGQARRRAASKAPKPRRATRQSQKEPRLSDKKPLS